MRRFPLRSITYPVKPGSRGREVLRTRQGLATNRRARQTLHRSGSCDRTAPPLASSRRRCPLLQLLPGVDHRTLLAPLVRFDWIYRFGWSRPTSRGGGAIKRLVGPIGGQWDVRQGGAASRVVAVLSPVTRTGGNQAHGFLAPCAFRTRKRERGAGTGPPCTPSKRRTATGGDDHRRVASGTGNGATANTHPSPGAVRRVPCQKACSFDEP